MAKNTFLNPQILPSTRDIRPQDHHKIINGALLAAFVALLIGFAYWWGNKEKEMSASPPVVVDSSASVLLTPEQIAEKQAAIDEVTRINSVPAKLTSKEIEQKKARIKEIQTSQSSL